MREPGLLGEAALRVFLVGASTCLEVLISMVNTNGGEWGIGRNVSGVRRRHRSVRFAHQWRKTSGKSPPGREQPRSLIPPVPLLRPLLLTPLPHLLLNPPSEWSVSAGSAQDEMSYLRLILIS